MTLAALVGCTSAGPEPAADNSTGEGEPSSSAGSSSAGSSTTGSSSGALDESTGEPGPVSCHDPRPIPPSRFDCRGVDGVAPVSVIIEADDDPAILAGVRRVEGALIVDRTNLTNLDFMGCVEEVTGDVMIHGNHALTNVDGLWGLRSLGADFVLSHNDALTDFDGVPNVETMSGMIMIHENAALEVITGFHSLVGLEGQMVYDPFSGMQVIRGGLWIRSNPVLRSIDGLGRLVVVRETFAVNHNPSLCISSINCVGSGIVEPETPPASWTAIGNDEGC